jgi:branched-chain amino acid transport system ATP-binding protein
MNMFSSATKVGVEETMKVLQLCGLADKVKLIAGELSQGDKKKLELAIALAGQPKLLFLDEPTAGMSLEETQETMELVDLLNRDLELSILFTEHDMSVIFNHAQRVTLLHQGQIIIEGSPDEVRDDETAKKIYLGEQHL